MIVRAALAAIVLASVAAAADPFQRAVDRGETSFFGIPARGFKFVYVIDRSGSTDRAGAAGITPLAAAKEELIASLRRLQPNQLFQIVFYNERPVVFSASGREGRLTFATEQNKDEAARFVRSIVPAGGTQHEDALMRALALAPDVVYFLTDADEPRLTPRQLEKVVDRAAGVQINAVEFGFGRQPAGETFLARLAGASGGTHAYVDLDAYRRP